jgi:NAD(P)-dependent dehydrogenase (short-subunit alcohol dehydrogenase family)
MHVKELLSLEGKIILVTGGAGNYGRCIVEGLAEADGIVITASRNAEAGQKLAHEFKARGLNVYAMRVDQADHVNNAVTRPMHGYNEPIEHFAESMRVNATGMMDILREMTDLIAESGGGSVINISSMMGMFGPDLSNYEGTDMGDMPPDYFFHRAGMINITRFLARMLAGKNIRVNCISPGGLFSNQPRQFVANYNKKVPLGRMANKDDIKGLAVLLASDASAYINGENVLMDGGMHA